ARCSCGLLRGCHSPSTITAGAKNTSTGPSTASTASVAGSSGQAHGAVRKRVSAAVDTGAPGGLAGPSRQTSAVSRPSSRTTSSTGPAQTCPPGASPRATVTGWPRLAVPGDCQIGRTASAGGETGARSTLSGSPAAPGVVAIRVPSSSVTSAAYSTTRRSPASDARVTSTGRSRRRAASSRCPVTQPESATASSTTAAGRGSGQQAIVDGIRLHGTAAEVRHARIHEGPRGAIPAYDDRTRGVVRIVCLEADLVRRLLDPVEQHDVIQ